MVYGLEKWILPYFKYALHYFNTMINVLEDSCRTCRLGGYARTVAQQYDKF